jgi:hypothetical protein
MKLTIFFLLSFTTFNVFGQITPSPLSHSIDPTCIYQVSRAIISDATARYGQRYNILTSGLDVDTYMQADSYPGIFYSKAVITLISESTRLKSEIYYSTSSGSTGLGGDENPLHRCKFSIEQISRTQYESLGRGR